MEDFNKYMNLSIEELDKLIIELFKERRFDDEEIEDLLDIRKGKLDAEFKWTPETKKKFLKLNDLIWNCFKKLSKEANNLREVLQRRVGENDIFLHDFEIKAIVTPFFYEEIDREKYEIDHGIEEVLMMYWKKHLLRCIETTENNDAFGVDKEINYNDYSLYREHFANDFVSRPMHYLWDLSNWSHQDVLKINHLWAELEVKYQHFMDV